MYYTDDRLKWYQKRLYGGDEGAIATPGILKQVNPLLCYSY